MATEEKLENPQIIKEPTIAETEQVKVKTEDVKVEEEKKVETGDVKIEEKKIEIENPKVEEEEKKKSEEEVKNVENGATVIERKMETETEKKVEEDKAEIERSSSLKEETEAETNLSSDLKENELKALNEFRSKLEEAILENKLFQATKVKEREVPATTTKTGEDDKDPKEKAEEPKEKTEKESEGEKGETSASASASGAASAEEVIKAETKEQVKAEEKEEDAKGKQVVVNEEEAKENINVVVKQDREVKQEYIVDKDIAIWGVPLLPSKGDNRTDTVLLKFLRAKDFKTNDAFEMLRNTMKWRKENKIDSILDEDIGADVGSMATMEGHDRNGHPVCYNFFSVLGNEDMYGKTFEERREKFMRGRIQIMEKGIQKLDFKPGGVSSILQISDLKNTPLPTKKELRTATKKVVELLQDNYPEFVSKNIFINVPFWYYAYSALFSPSLSQRTKNKIVYARSARVSDTLLKYIPASQIPVQYGGLKRESDKEFSVGEEVKETTVKAGSTEVIEILAPEEGKTLVWEVSVSGWEINYKEEFVPADEGSYTVIVSKGKRIAFQDGTLRNSFTNKEAGKIVITIENGAFKKKRILYRYKLNDVSSSSSTSS